MKTHATVGTATCLGPTRNIGGDNDNDDDDDVFI